MADTVQGVLSNTLPAVVSTIEVRSLFSPTVTFNVADLLAPSGPSQPPNPLVRLVKPTIVLSGPGIGDQVVAPGGAVGPDDWKTPATLVAVLGLVAATLVIKSAWVVGHKASRRGRR